MDHDRLRSWLGLPPGPWPPDHYTLLGLAPGAGEYAEVEARVLDLMERLRPHQLLHPDAVTEGMNRLAQALVCLTDPVARAAYDRASGFAPAVPFEVVEDEPPAVAPGATLARAPEPPKPPYEVAWAPEPDPLPYEVVGKEPPKPPYEVVPDESVAKEPQPPPLPPYEVVPDEEAKPDRAPVEPPAPASRRELYRRLAAVRKALLAWEKLRPVLANPAEPLATPVAVLLFLQALSEARDALPGVDGVIRRPAAPGGVVAALVRSSHALHALRTLLPVQRQAVATDWQRGHEALRREHVRLRELAFAGRPRRGRMADLLRVLRRDPEWILLVFGLTVLLLALVRRNS